jgi:hypothetical protein
MSKCIEIHISGNINGNGSGVPGKGGIDNVR